MAWAYESPSAGFLMTLKILTPDFPDYGADMLTVFSLYVDSSSTNVTQTHNESNPIIFSITFLLKKIASCKVVEVRISLIMIMLSGVACAVFMHPYKVVCSLPRRSLISSIFSNG